MNCPDCDREIRGEKCVCGFEKPKTNEEKRAEEIMCAWTGCGRPGTIGFNRKLFYCWEHFERKRFD